MSGGGKKKTDAVRGVYEDRTKTLKNKKGA